MQVETKLCRGTLGDTYIFLLKILYDDKRINIKHHTKHKYFEESIKEIYSLSIRPNVEFIDYVPDDVEEITSDPHEGNMIFFPLFDLFDNFCIKKPYTVIQAHSGKPYGFNCKKLSKEYLNFLINSLDGRKVLLGTDTYYSDIDNCINLVGKTTIKYSIPIINYSSKFIGPEGLLSFVALSHRVESDIIYTSEEAISRRIINTPWETYVNNFTKLEDTHEITKKIIFDLCTNNISNFSIL